MFYCSCITVIAVYVMLIFLSVALVIIYVQVVHFDVRNTKWVVYCVLFTTVLQLSQRSELTVSLKPC